MKITKVNGGRLAVAKTGTQSKGDDVEGIYYDRRTESIETLIKRRIKNVESLYNIFSTIQAGEPPKKPKSDADEIKLQRYNNKTYNYDNRVIYGEILAKVGKEIMKLFLDEGNRDGRKYRVLRKEEEIIQLMKGRSNNFSVWFSTVRENKKEELINKDGNDSFNARVLVMLALRKSLSDVVEEAEVFINCIGKKQVTDEELKKIKCFIGAVKRDYNKYSANVDQMIRALKHTNLVIQPSDTDFSVPIPPQDGKKTTRKADEKKGLQSFLNHYAELDEEKRRDCLRILRRIIDLYFDAPEDYTNDDASTLILEHVCCKNDYSVWVQHEAGKKMEGLFVEVDETIQNESEVASIDLKKSYIELAERMRDRNIVCYRFAAKWMEKNPQYFFEEKEINQFWLHHISNSVERILCIKEKTLERKWKFRLQLGYLKEKVWKDALNFISIKYIAIGKTVFHFGLNELESENQIIHLGTVPEEKISSFDLELIKAKETLQRELAVDISFATNNLARATIESKQSDILSIKKTELPFHHKKEENELLKSILQFWGGESQWKDFVFEEQIKEEKYATALLEELLKRLRSARNSTFHYRSNVQMYDDWNLELIGKMFLHDANLCSSLARDKFYSNNLPLFYKRDDLKKTLDALYSRTSQRWSQVPAFNSVISRNSFRSFYTESLCISTKKAEKELREKWEHACYYLLKEIYYNGFLQEQDVKVIFEEALRIEANSTENDNQRRAFESFKKFVTKFLEQTDISLAQLCQVVMSEYNLQNNQRRKKKSSFDSMLDKDIYQHFKLFLVKCLRRAFASYVGEKYEFIKNPCFDKEMIALNEFLPDWTTDAYYDLSEMVKKSPELQQWYVVSRLLNARMLNLMVGSMRSYVQYVEDVNRRAQRVNTRPSINQNQDIKRINQIIKVVDMCIILSSRFSNEIGDYFKDSDDYVAFLKTFVDLEDYSAGGIFFDGKNPIMNRNILMAKLYGPSHVLSQTVDKVTDKDIASYVDQAKNLTEIKKGDNEATQEKKKEAMIEYQRMKNHVELRDLVEYGEIINELLGQLINWCYICERDLMYFQLGFHYKCLSNSLMISDNYVSIKNGDKQYDNAILYQIVAMYVYGLEILGSQSDTKYALTSAKVKSFVQVYSKKIYYAGLEVFVNINENDSIYPVRNSIDHFHYYQKEPSYSLLDLYSEVFDRFFTYDMKYQKNVANMLYNILLQHGMMTNLSFASGEKSVGGNKTKERAAIVVNALTSEKYTYKYIGEQKKKSFLLDARSTEYMETIMKILYYPRPVPETVKLLSREKTITDANEKSESKPSSRKKTKSSSINNSLALALQGINLEK